MFLPFRCFALFSTRALRCLSALFALAMLSLLSACGAGSTFSPITPTKIIAFGDGVTDLGQTGVRYTINDGSNSIWTERVAINYGLTLTTSVTGGLSYATVGARITAGSNSIEQQISAHLAKGAISSGDLFLLDPGINELFALMQARQSGSIASDAELYAAAKAAGTALAVQAHRLSAAGAKHIVMSNAYNIGTSPYAASNTLAVSFGTMVRQFNDAFKIGVGDMGNVALLVDAEAYFSLVYNNSITYLGSGANNTGVACTTPTANSCTTSTLTGGEGSNYNLYVFADDRYFTPGLNRLWGDNVFSRIRNRF